jgi:uncharacterized protein YukE
MKIKSIFSFVVVAGILGGLIYGLANIRDIRDWLSLRGYNPPAKVVELADATTMTNQTRRVFYINHPELDDKVAFRQHCRTTEQSIVLGCYVENDGIYLLKVQDPRLNGVVEVTAAHEALHAEYDRLSSSEKKKVDHMTEDYFKTLKNKRIQETIENYRKKDPSVVPNELHSILGTEVRDLSPELESYYNKYFKDRLAIVSFSEKYEQTFINLRGQVAGYDASLANLKEQIESNEAEIASLNTELQSQRAHMDRLFSNGQKEEYNSLVSSYNQKVSEYNRLINTTKQLIDEFNETVDKRNGLAAVEQELINKLDSSKLSEKETR